MLGWLRRGKDDAPATAAAAAPVNARAVTAGGLTLNEMSGIISFLDGGMVSAGEPVSIDSALGVPAVFCATEFLSRTLASLPLELYRSGRDGEPERLGDDLAGIIGEAPNERQSSFDWRKYGWEQTFTYGRQLTFIERNTAGRIIGLHPLNPEKVVVERRDGRVQYRYSENARNFVYAAGEIIDIPFMLKADGLTARSPILTNAEVIGMAQAVTKYAAAWFRNGGVPPFAVTAPFQTVQALGAAAADFDRAVKEAAAQKKQALVMPAGMEVKSLGGDAEKAQMIAAQRFAVEQIARIFGLPPVFLQDLTNGTLNNVEQQDLHLTKHVIRPWAKQAEDEMNLKLFGWKRRDLWVRHNLDGLLRGDFKTRMEGYAVAIQHGVSTPNEARRMEGKLPLAGGDSLFMQGAMMPIQDLGAGTEGNGNAA